MENQFFLNSGVSQTQTQQHHPLLQFEPPSWQSQNMGIQQSVMMNCASDQTQDDSFYNHPNWDKSTPTSDHGLLNHHFDSSALSSMVSSPAATSSNPNNNITNENFIIRELLGKLGAIGSSDEIPQQHSLIVASSSYMNNNNNNNGNNNNRTNTSSCYSTPLSSPPKPMALNSSVAEFSADPGFAERAAKFSCFGSRSFNDRRSVQLSVNNAELPQRSVVPVMEHGVKLPRVSSSPLLKTLGSQIGVKENNDSAFQEHERMEVEANSQEESTISEQTPIGVKTSHDVTNSRKRKASSKGKSKGVEGSEDDSNSKRSKANNNEDEGNEKNHPMKVEEESKAAVEEKQQNKSNSSKPPEPPKDYIHVRARRGQATDSHSLAERVRREKISERMKLLQDLVPGCNKVTGKALMLDEIINYVQSLQRQVEFLSMKLANVNIRMDLSVESPITKDVFQSSNSLATHQNAIFSLDSSAEAFYGHQAQQNPVIHNNNNIPNRTVTHCSVDPLDASLCQNLAMHLPLLNGFNEGGSQFPLTFLEDDLHTIVQMGFGQAANMKTSIQSPSFNGSNNVPQMKIEL